jgi:hypothetical protein
VLAVDFANPTASVAHRLKALNRNPSWRILFRASSPPSGYEMRPVGSKYILRVPVCGTACSVGGKGDGVVGRSWGMQPPSNLPLAAAPQFLMQWIQRGGCLQRDAQVLPENRRIKAPDGQTTPSRPRRSDGATASGWRHDALPTADAHAGTINLASNHWKQESGHARPLPVVASCGDGAVSRSIGLSGRSIHRSFRMAPRLKTGHQADQAGALLTLLV